MARRVDTDCLRKDVYERMKYFVVEKIKPNYSAIARQYGVDPRTVKGGFKLSFYSGLKMYDLGGLRIDRCQAI